MAEWEAYDRLEPIGEWRGDFRMAVLAATITNLFISVYGKKGTTKHVKVEDFMPDWNRRFGRENIQTAEEMKNVLLSLVDNVKVKNKEK